MPKLTDEQRQQITNAIYEGKTVDVINGQVHVAPLPSGPTHTGGDMSAYVQSRLDALDDRIEHGWNFTITPDGSVNGWNHDGSRLASSPDGKVGPQAVEIAHAAIQSGRAVTVQPDGTLVTSPPPISDSHTGRPIGSETDDDVKSVAQSNFDRDLKSGELEMRAKEGATVTYGHHTTPLSTDTDAHQGAPADGPAAPAPQTDPSADPGRATDGGAGPTDGAPTAGAGQEHAAGGAEAGRPSAQDDSGIGHDPAALDSSSPAAASAMADAQPGAATTTGEAAPAGAPAGQVDGPELSHPAQPAASDPATGMDDLSSPPGATAAPEASSDDGPNLEAGAAPAEPDQTAP
jgi:hypothetical protein